MKFLLKLKQHAILPIILLSELLSNLIMNTLIGSIRQDRDTNLTSLFNHTNLGSI